MDASQNTASKVEKIFEKNDVVNIINSLIKKVETEESSYKEHITKELRDLHQIIEDTRHAIAASRSTEINDDHIPTATDELDAVVEATAEATGTIMDSCEAIEHKAEELGKAGDSASESLLAENVTKIYEACSFQDITGQRITNVVKALKNIEEKVNKLLAVLGELPAAGEAAPVDAGKKDDGDSLMNGPQLKGAGVTQDDIDKLLEDF